MLRLIVTIALIGLTGIAHARPSYLGAAVLPAYEHHVEYAPTIVGHTAFSLPTAVSHQSQTIIHEKRPYIHPIVEHTPILKTAYPAHYVKTAYVPTATIGVPTVYSGLGYTSLYGSGWSPSLSGWIK